MDVDCDVVMRGLDVRAKHAPFSHGYVGGQSTSSCSWTWSTSVSWHNHGRREAVPTIAGVETPGTGEGKSGRKAGPNLKADRLFLP